MKLATYRHGADIKIGIVDAAKATVFDLAAAAARAGRPGPYGSMLELIDADDAGLDAARALHEARKGEADLSRPLSEIALLAPLPSRARCATACPTRPTSASPAAADAR